MESKFLSNLADIGKDANTKAAMPSLFSYQRMQYHTEICWGRFRMWLTPRLVVEAMCSTYWKKAKMRITCDSELKFVFSRVQVPEVFVTLKENRKEPSVSSLNDSGTFKQINEGSFVRLMASQLSHPNIVGGSDMFSEAFHMVNHIIDNLRRIHNRSGGLNWCPDWGNVGNDECSEDELSDDLDSISAESSGKCMYINGKEFVWDLLKEKEYMFEQIPN